MKPRSEADTLKSAYQLEIEEKLRSLLEPVVADGGCELVELQFVRRKSSSLLRLLIDRLGGVTVDDCADISHRVSFVLETEDPIESRYTLEVSSPGLDRPLTTAADFRRKVGETVKVLVEEPETRYEVTGVIVAVEEDRLVLQTEGGNSSCLLKDVVRGKILF